MSLPEVYAATKYGWGVVYCLTVEGIDTVFCERELSLTLPGSGPFSGYSAQDGSLVVDDSAPIGSDVDRSSGVGVGLSFAFMLLDTRVVRLALLAPTNTAKLTANVTAVATSVTVDDTTGWPASGEFWLGNERITYSSKNVTQFLGCTRGTAGGKSYAHTMGASSGVATSSPRWWVGREVALWAYAIDPVGQVPNSSTAMGASADFVCVWRGYIEDGPQRVAPGFKFEASALDRRLDRPFQAKVSGRIVDSTSRHNVAPTDTYKIDIECYNQSNVQQWSHSLTWSPYSSLSAATLYTGAEIRAAVTSSFAAAVTAAGAPTNTRISGLKWVQKNTPSGPVYRATIVVFAAAVSNYDRVVIYFHGDAAVQSNWTDRIVHNASQDVDVPPPWKSFWETFDAPNNPDLDTGAGLFGFTIALDNGSPDVVQAPVTIEIAGPDDSSTTKLTCAKVSNIQGLLYVSQFVDVSGYNQPGMQIEGKTASALYSAHGTIKNVVLEHLHSSGTQHLRDGTYDVLPRAQGYGLITDRVNQSSFGLLNQSAFAGMQIDTTTGSRSFVEIFSGLFALAQLAIVARPDISSTHRDIKLQLVRTSLGTTGGDVIISDGDLLSLAESPVEILNRARPENYITLKLDGDGQIIYTDQSSVDTIGTVERAWNIPHDDREQILQISTPLVAGYLATQPTVQTFVLRVGPNIDAHVGDCVTLNLTHPAIYDWQTGTQGYVGPAVVLGRAYDLRSMSVTLTCAASASVSTKAISPSVLVTAYAAGTSIDCNRGWYKHFAQTLADSGGTFRLIIYDPGVTEASTNYLVINDVADTGAATRLTIASASGTLTPTANVTHATLPETANASAFQLTFAHVGDGGFWI